MKLIRRFRAVLLVFVLLPLLTIAITPPTVSAGPTDHYLKLVSLKCIETEDTLSSDEPYLKTHDRADRNTEIWTDSLNNGDSDDLTHIPAMKFYDWVHIELYEHDPLDSEDWLGEHFVFASEVGTGLRTVSFSADGANYRLTYYTY